MAPSENGKRVRCVLIEGESGIGKTTMMQQICLRWARGELEQYNLVVLVKLRKVHATCLEDIFEKLSDNNMNDVLDAIGNGSGTLVILDGYDELIACTTANQPSSKSFYEQLIGGMRMLSKATIIITSRPSLSAHLMDLIGIGRHLKISGFTEKQIMEHVELKFSSERRAAFARNPIIKMMMCFPLYTSFLATISVSNSSPQPKTVVELYNEFTCSLIRRHLEARNEVNYDFNMVVPLHQELPSLVDEQQKRIRGQFKRIVQKAYDGLMTGMCDFIAGVDVDQNFEHLGVMKKAQENVHNGHGGVIYKFSFFHLSHQEYLAALHIVYTPDLQVPDSFGKRDILRFLAGMCCGKDTVDKRVGRLLQSAGDQCGLQMVRCLYECEEIKDKIPMVHEILFKGGPVKVRGRVPFDYYLIGHCICHINCRHWNITVHSKDEIDRLRDGLESGHCKIKGEILNLEIQIRFGPALANIQQILVSIQKITAKIHSLNLEFITFTDGDRDILKEVIERKALHKIEIRSSCKNVDLLLNALFKPNSSLNTVCLSGTLKVGSNTDSIADTVTNLLHENKNLEKLRIDDMIITPKTLADILQSDDSLKQLKELTFCVTQTSDHEYYNYRNPAANFRSESHSFTSFPIRSTKLASVVPPLTLCLKEAAQKRNIKLEIVCCSSSNTLTLRRLPQSSGHRSQTVHVH